MAAIIRTPEVRKQELDEFYEAVETVCMFCVRPDADDGGEEACECCFVRKTWDWFREEYKSLSKHV